MPAPSMPRWVELAVLASPEAVDAVAEVLAGIVTSGVAIVPPFALRDEGEQVEFLTSQPSLVTAYLTEAEWTPNLRQRATENIWRLRWIQSDLVGELRERFVEEEQWADAWKAYFHPMRIGRRLVIKPTWRDFEATPNDVVIQIDPGMAFGTGQHPTTALCLRALETLVQPGQRVCDVGAGSGILAIAAALLGAASVDAIDISADAVRIAAENAALNGLTDSVTVRRHDVLASDAEGSGSVVYDVVIANIIASVIAAGAGALAKLVAPQGSLLASGIIAERGPEVSVALVDAGFIIVETWTEGDWLALHARRAHAASLPHP